MAVVERVKHVCVCVYGHRYYSPGTFRGYNIYGMAGFSLASNHVIVASYTYRHVNNALCNGCVHSCSMMYSLTSSRCAYLYSITVHVHCTCVCVCVCLKLAEHVFSIHALGGR